ncbi:MAG: (2Fe-2S) ferredoxin domain-containing protein [Treponema sp.]|jgi:NADP-reducing hydrogenase subunit HndB|nr:(2Fe-2S) ferredoxin domain-containing protein [Treponema sp.]
MAKMSLDDLRKLRASTKSEIERRETDGKTMQIVVGMGTCGIAAGAKETLDAFIKAAESKNIASNVIIRQTGCMGFCANEPTVEVLAPDMPAVIYGNVNTAVASEIVEKHLIGKALLDKQILDRPSIDILKK